MITYDCRKRGIFYKRYCIGKSNIHQPSRLQGAGRKGRENEDIGSYEKILGRARVDTDVCHDTCEYVAFTGD